MRSLLKKPEKGLSAAPAALRSTAGSVRRQLCAGVIGNLGQPIAQWAQSRNADPAERLADCGGGGGRGTGDLPGEPQLQARGFWQHMERAPVGMHRQPSAPFRENGEPYTVTRPAPTPGQYNTDVLQGVLGLSEAALEKLAAAACDVIGTLPILPERRKVKVQSR